MMQEMHLKLKGFSWVVGLFPGSHRGRVGTQQCWGRMGCSGRHSGFRRSGPPKPGKVEGVGPSTFISL